MKRKLEAPFEEPLAKRFAEVTNSLVKQGEQFYKKKQFTEALLFLNRAIMFQPNEPLALAIRGDIHTQLGDMQLAFADFNTLLTLQPNHVFALSRRGELWR